MTAFGKCAAVVICHWFCVCGFVRVIQQAFIDMENMFDLMKEKQEVSDVPLARCDILICQSHYQEFVYCEGVSQNAQICLTWDDIENENRCRLQACR